GTRSDARRRAAANRAARRHGWRWWWRGGSGWTVGQSDGRTAAQLLPRASVRPSDRPTVRPSPPHLQLHHAAVVVELQPLLSEHLVVGHHLEVVAADEVLQSDEVAGRAVGRDLIARVVLLDTAQQLHQLGNDAVPRQGVPAERVN